MSKVTTEVKMFVISYATRLCFTTEITLNSTLQKSVKLLNGCLTV